MTPLTLNPYGIYPYDPELDDQIGREYFARIARKRHMGFVLRSANAY